MKYTLRVTLSCMFILIATTISFAQKEKDDDDYLDNRDSTWGLDFNFKKLDQNAVKIKVLEAKLDKINRYNDSMLTIIRAKNIKERSDSLEALYDYLSKDTSTSYNAYSFFAGQYHSGLSGINQSLAASGWPKLKDVSYHFTNFLDFTWKRNRHINDVFIAVGNPVTATKGDVSITYSYSSLLNYTYGYCFLDSKRFQFFPFAGLGYQNSNLIFSNSSQQLFDLGKGLYDTLLKATAVNKRGVEYKFNRRDIVLSYGVEFDFHVIYSKRKTGFILGVRGGKTQILLGNGWQVDGRRYSQIKNINVRDYYFDVVLRIYGRGNGNRGKHYLKKGWWENKED